MCLRVGVFVFKYVCRKNRCREVRYLFDVKGGVAKKLKKLLHEIYEVLRYIIL